jgi:hypothetical protein
MSHKCSGGRCRCCVHVEVETVLGLKLGHVGVVVVLKAARAKTDRELQLLATIWHAGRMMRVAAYTLASLGSVQGAGSTGEAKRRAAMGAAA